MKVTLDHLHKLIVVVFNLQSQSHKSFGRQYQRQYFRGLSTDAKIFDGAALTIMFQPMDCKSFIEFAAETLAYQAIQTKELCNTYVGGGRELGLLGVPWNILGS